VGSVGSASQWWTKFLRDSGGTGFWHETYFMRGGMEAVYDDMVATTGFLAFAQAMPARGPLFSARTRAPRRRNSDGGRRRCSEEDL
jgi:hypothetical protein